MRTLSCYLLALTFAVGTLQAVEVQDDKIVVLTAMPVTFSISSFLARNTSISVQNVPERARPMSALGNFLETRAEQLSEQFRTAGAVVTIGKLWREDPLFTAVRAANIHVVDIDATKPWSVSLEGVSVALQPLQDVPWTEPDQHGRAPSVYFWLSPANGARTAEIIAADFIRLSPKDSAQIDRNLIDYRRQLLDLKLEYEVKFATLPDITVFALAPEFVYLTSDLGLSVDGYFLKQDIAWTSEDLKNFESYLKNNEIAVAIHKWEPAEPIRAAVNAAGSRLVVLDMIDIGIDEDGRLSDHSYLELMRKNLEALYGALKAAN